MRSGTINVPGIVGLYHSLKYSCHKLTKFNEYVSDLKAYFEQEMERFACFEVVAKNENRSPFISNILSTKYDAHILFSEVQDKINYSTSSACSSKKNKGSHVLQAMGYTNEQSSNSVRFSFSHLTTKRSIKKLLHLIHNQIKKLQQ
jgi:cysteine desulfurase